MDKALTDWIERLSPLTLPAMALTRQRVMQLLDSPNTTHADLQRILSRDPGFTLAIFRLFSTLPQPPREPVTNLAHAIALLGIEPTTQADRQLPNLEKQLKNAARTALYDCYSRAGHAAWYAYRWGHDLRLSNPEEMAIAALLHELGEMMLWTHAEQQMQQITALIKRGMNASTAEETILGFNLQQLSLQLAQRWNLPPLVALSLQPVGAFQMRSLAVMLAAALARASRDGWHSDQTDELIGLAATLNGLEPDRGRAYIHELTAGVARNLSGLPLTLTVYALLERPKASQKQAKRPTDAPMPPPIDGDTIPIGQTAPTAPAASQNKSRATAAADNPLQAGLSRLFRELRESAGVERVMFAMLTPDRQSLKAKFISGADQDSPLRRFHQPLSERQLLGLLMKKPQSIWLRPENRDQLLARMNASLQGSFDVRGFYLSSLYINNRPVGILYADHTDVTSLSPEGFQRFKRLSQRLCHELSRKNGSNQTASLLTDRRLV
ncbi:HDOD domain-containing protein [Sedimenticola sp.]|uniref:HDOD domain-containing protein n=1 Tax=Sedimenticola sp. TaxID=1940285 RepID=UPI003D141849